MLPRHGSPYQHLLIDDPAPGVRRLTLNRPEKRNALNNRLRGELFHALEVFDRDAAARVAILRGSGSCFSAGYDLGANNAEAMPYATALGDGFWPRATSSRAGSGSGTSRSR